MSDKNEYSIEQGKAIYEYPADGLIRRRLHEFGATGFDFYGEMLRRMRYHPADFALDVGAGMGFDGLKIAIDYRPRLVSLLEPAADKTDDFDNIYFQLEEEIKRQGIQNVHLLSSDSLSATITGIANPESEILAKGETYIQPIPGVAEAIPLPDGSVTKLTMIHSAYHFQDIHRAMTQAQRVLRRDGWGMLVTNSSGDKAEFKNFLSQVSDKLKNNVIGTVSSRLDDKAALDILSIYFDVVEILPYQDTMVITQDRVPDYLYAFDSYRNFFDRPVINDGRWYKARHEVVEERIGQDIAATGSFLDTIDIRAIYFKHK